MAHALTGLVAPLLRLARLSEKHRLGTTYPLANDFAFLPLDNQNLGGFVGKDAGPSLGSFRYLTQALVDRLAPLSAADGRFAYIETEYFGGDGWQGAVTFADGKVIAGPDGEPKAINRALILLSVPNTTRPDPFDTVGLGRIRSNSDARSPSS